MAFPGPGNTDSVLRSEADAGFLLASLEAALGDDYFGGIEITHVGDPQHRAQVAEALCTARPEGLEVAFLCQPVQLANEDGLTDPSDICALDEDERAKAVARVLSLVDEAAELGASKLELLSGRDPAYAVGDVRRAETLREGGRVSLLRSLDEICHAASERELVVLLEIFDNIEEPGGPRLFKGQLIGPAADAVALAERLRADRGHGNFGLLYDSSHMAMMGEKPDTLRMLIPYLGHVHVANCVTVAEGDAASRRGDLHPKFGVAESAVGSEVLAEFVRELVEIDYGGTIGFEVRPVGSERPLGVIAGAKTAFEEACRSVRVAFARPGQYVFRSREFFPESAFAEITALRVDQPGLAAELLEKRSIRPSLTEDGNLTILAADHPARNVTAVGDDPMAMGDRYDLLGRIMRVMLGSDVDGLMATSDLMDDFVLADYVLQQRGHASALADRVLIGSMNRTGLAGAEHEMLDRGSSYRSASRIRQMHLDGAKLMLRLCLADKNDRYVLQTMEWCAEAMEQCHDLELPVFFEPLPVRRTEGGYATIKEPDPLIKAIGVAQALSHSTARTWLKTPYVPEFGRVARATTLPILLLGGEATGRPWETVEDFVRGMGAAPNVRGALVGRNVLYPGDEDPAVIAQAVHLAVHERVGATEAIQAASERRGK